MTNVVTDAVVTDMRCHDSRQFVPLLDGTALNFDVQNVVADKGYSTKAILQTVSDRGATPYIPFIARKAPQVLDPVLAVAPHASAPAWDRMYHMFAYSA